MLAVGKVGIEAELADPRQELLEEDLDLDPGQRRANAFVRAVAEGVVIARKDAAVEIDFERIGVFALVDPRQVVRDHDHLVTLELDAPVLEVARDQPAGVGQAEAAEKFLGRLGDDPRIVAQALLLGCVGISVYAMIRLVLRIRRLRRPAP